MRLTYIIKMLLLLPVLSEIILSWPRWFTLVCLSTSSNAGSVDREERAAVNWDLYTI